MLLWYIMIKCSKETQSNIFFIKINLIKIEFSIKLVLAPPFYWQVNITWLSGVHYVLPFLQLHRYARRTTFLKHARVLCFILFQCYFVAPRTHNSYIWTGNLIHTVTVSQPTCIAIFHELINSHKHLYYLHLWVSFVLPTSTFIYGSIEILQSLIESKYFFWNWLAY